MCDLNVAESRYLVEALDQISGLAQEVRTHASSITSTNYMDHEALAAVLTTLDERVAATRQWVVEKPQEHAGHAGHAAD